MNVLRTVGLGICCSALWASCMAAAPAPTFRSMVEADWSAQEKRLGRARTDSDAIHAALDRAARLLEDLSRLPAAPSLSAETAELADLRQAAANLDTLDKPARLVLYHRVRWLTRDAALKNPLLGNKPLVFEKRRRFVCQMLHEYLGYFHEGPAGGGIYVLQSPGHSFDIRDLIGSRLPKGFFATLALSYDAKTLYFAFAPAAAQKPDFYDPQPGRRYFHIYAMSVDGSNLRQLTDGPADDFDPCPLPDGGLAFMSSRRGAGFIRCSNPWEPIPAYTLHRMDADGKNIRTLSFHETNEWHPSVLNDGRIVYIRWDYVDRSAANYHGLWVSNPDGSTSMSLFGNYTSRINACYQPRAIPGSRKILFIAGAHHADVGGSLVMLDPSRVSLDARTGEDQLDPVERLTPETPFPETSKDWGKSYFHSPWPLSENYFLTAFSYDGVPGGPGGKRDVTGLYYLDRFGNMELLYRDADQEIASMYPIPLEKRPVPPTIPSTLDRTLADEGEFMVNNVRQSLMPLPSDRPIRELRIWQVLPKTTHIANEPRIGHANAESARLFLGTVPVEADGSAYFRAPARKPLYFQAVDGAGRAVQSMRSITYLQPGERRGCVGCHEPPGTLASLTPTLAMKRPPSRIEPGPEATRPMSYPRLIQPILDRHCVRCHDGAAGPGKSPLVLTGDPTKAFSRSYDNLRPYLRWFEWGGDSIAQVATFPGRIGADESRLTKILDDATHRPALQLTDADRRTIYLWLDGNVPFYGTYFPAEQAAQKAGQAVAIPASQ